MPVFVRDAQPCVASIFFCAPIMRTFVAVASLAAVLFLSSCKTTQPTEPGTIGTSVLGVTRALDTVYGKFYELAKSNPGKTPQQIVVMTAAWIKTQPNVQEAHWLDSTIIEIKMKSGLRTTFMINLMDKDSISLARGGTPRSAKGHVVRPETSKNVITNKNILIYSPFGACGKGTTGNFFTAAELAALVNVFTNSGKDFNVTLLRCSDCTVKAIESFGDYGLVIMDTHGLPDGFMTGHRIFGLSDLLADTNDAAIKVTLELNDHAGGLGEGGYDKVLDGMFRFSAVYDIVHVQSWQTFLATKTESPIIYRVLVNSEFINTLPSMPNTVVFGNMCYSGWRNPGTVHFSNGAEAAVTEPIQTAFMNRDLLSYYSYGYDDGTSAPVGNLFASIMEDSLIHSLVVDDDSTGNAYLSSTGQVFTGQQFNDYENLDMPFRHVGADDYSFENCIKEFTDDRDGQKYKAVCIGGQNWMAENLNYNAPGSVCYENNSANCSIYGRLYDWATLMQGAASSNSSPSHVQGVCPKYWHVPSIEEWVTLVDNLGGSPKAGGALKDVTRWTSPNGGATNSSGFSALPGGRYDAVTSFGDLGNYGVWWSSSITTGTLASNLFLSYSAARAAYGEWETSSKISCRCVKD